MQRKPILRALKGRLSDGWAELSGRPDQVAAICADFMLEVVTELSGQVGALQKLLGESAQGKLLAALDYISRIGVHTCGGNDGNQCGPCLADRAIAEFEPRLNPPLPVPGHADSADDLHEHGGTR